MASRHGSLTSLPTAKARRKKALADLKEAIQGYVETFGLEDALARVNSPVSVRQIEWNLSESRLAKLPRATGKEMVRFLEQPDSSCCGSVEAITTSKETAGERLSRSTVTARSSSALCGASSATSR